MWNCTTLQNTFMCILEKYWLHSKNVFSSQKNVFSSQHVNWCNNGTNAKFKFRLKNNTESFYNSARDKNWAMGRGLLLWQSGLIANVKLHCYF